MTATYLHRALPSGWSYASTPRRLTVYTPDRRAHELPLTFLADVLEWEAGFIGDSALLARIGLAI
jgi:hypothetical protein